MDLKIRNYNKKDLKAVWRLWQSTIGDKWPIDILFFESIIQGNFSRTLHLVAEVNKEVVGFIASRYDKSSGNTRKASLLVLLVDKKFQKKGIGKLLLGAIVEKLSTNNIKKFRLGSGVGQYFWPGVPQNLPSAIQFFKSCGFDFKEVSYDLVVETNNAFISENININKEITIKNIEQENISDLLKFEKVNFPGWYDYFDIVLKAKKYHDILIAKDNKQNIVGSVLLFGPYDSNLNVSFRWKNILGNKMGGLGALGVCESARGIGIGMSLAIEATNVLKNRGVKNSYVGWTWLTDWYGRIGYKVWRSYKMGHVDIN